MEKKIERKHLDSLDSAVKKVRSTMTPETLRQYEEIMREFMGYAEERKEREKTYA